MPIIYNKKYSERRYEVLVKSERSEGYNFGEVRSSEVLGEPPAPDHGPRHHHSLLLTSGLQVRINWTRNVILYREDQEELLTEHFRAITEIFKIDLLEKSVPTVVFNISMGHKQNIIVIRTVRIFKMMDMILILFIIWFLVMLLVMFLWME